MLLRLALAVTLLLPALHDAADTVPDFDEDLARNVMFPLAAGSYADDAQPCLDYTMPGAKVSMRVEVPCDTIETDTCSAYTVVDEGRKRIGLVFRGTSTKEQLVDEIATTLFENKTEFRSGGSTSVYFAVAFDDLWYGAGLGADLLYLANKYPSYTLLITGHSLGGSFAALAAVHVLNNQLFPAKQKGASWWATDRGGATPLHWAVQGGAIKVIRHILASLRYDPMGNSVFLIKDKEGVTPMHIAAKRSSSKILKMFADALDGEDVFKKARDAKDRSPLHYAATYASIECVQLILDEDKLGLPVDQKDCFHLTPLMCAAGVDLPQSVEIVRLLVARKPLSISAANKDRQSALHLAVAANNLRVVDALIEIKPEIIENCDAELRTPLHYAAEAGHVEAVEKLLRAGSRNTMRDSFGVTPAHYAAQHSKKALQKLLVHAKLNAVQPRAPTRIDEDEKETVQDVKDKDQRSCLMWAVIAGNLESIKYLLSASRPDRQDQDAYGYNALHLAALMNDEAVCRELMRQGWNPNERTKSDMTALHLAAGRANTPDVIQTLVTKGALLNEKDARGRTPIFMACFGGKAHNLNVMIRELGFEWRLQSPYKCRGVVAKFAPVRDDFNRTLLHAAAYAGYSACISTMVLIEEEEGAPLITPLVHWKDIEGETALHIACAEGKTDCVITLCSRGADKNALSGNPGRHPPGPERMRTPLAQAREKRTEERKGSYDAVISYLERSGGLANAYLVRWCAVITIQRGWRSVTTARPRPTSTTSSTKVPIYFRVDYGAFRAALADLRAERAAATAASVAAAPPPAALLTKRL